MKLRPRPPLMYQLVATTREKTRIIVDVFTSKKAAEDALASVERGQSTYGQVPTVERFDIVTRISSGT